MKKPSLALVFVSSLVLVACGQEQPATPAKKPAAEAPAQKPAAAAPAQTAGNEQGKSVYGKTCALCHAAGVAGAPKPGDKADWGPRIAQGEATLYKHAIEGFTGAKGQMPPRGGATTLSDAEVKAAVDFMVAQSR